jgi:hypothetical protein
MGEKGRYVSSFPFLLACHRQRFENARRKRDTHSARDNHVYCAHFFHVSHSQRPRAPERDKHSDHPTTDKSETERRRHQLPNFRCHVIAPSISFIVSPAACANAAG